MLLRLTDAPTNKHRRDRSHKERTADTTAHVRVGAALERFWREQLTGHALRRTGRIWRFGCVAGINAFQRVGNFPNACQMLWIFAVQAFCHSSIGRIIEEVRQRLRRPGLRAIDVRGRSASCTALTLHDIPKDLSRAFYRFGRIADKRNQLIDRCCRIAGGQNTLHGLLGFFVAVCQIVRNA